jgi:class 3 adenylate cyclase
MSPRTARARELLAEVEQELEVVEREIRSHRFIELIGAGDVPKERLGDLAGEQVTVIRSDRRSFAYLASRFPDAPAGDFFLGMSEGEGEALRRLLEYAAWAGLDEEALAAEQLNARAGIHVGEIELQGDDIAGLAVHVAARVMGEAGSDEVFVSRTVRDLTAGSGLQFEDRGTHPLKGIPEDRQLYALA